MRRRRYRLKGATKSINLWRDHRLFSCIAAAGTSNDQLDGQDNLLTCSYPLFVSEPSEEQFRSNTSQLGYWLTDNRDRRMKDVRHVKVIETGHCHVSGNLYSELRKR